MHLVRHVYHVANQIIIVTALSICIHADITFSSVCDSARLSVCPHNKTQMAETKITNLIADVLLVSEVRRTEIAGSCVINERDSFTESAHPVSSM